jgi:hypothetical protein
MTIAISYPTKANEVTKKKYYDLITNFPLFIPHDKIGNKFSQMIDKYPVTPYLDGKDAFIKWVHYIHNKINEELGKDSVLFTEALNTYYEKYKPKEIRLRDEMRYRRKLIISVLILILIIGAYYLYKK